MYCITDLLPTQVWFRWCIVRLRFHCFRFLLVWSNGCSIKWSFTNFLPKFGRVRTHILSFFSQFLFVFFRSYCANWVLCVPQCEAGYTLVLISCRKILFFNGFSLKIFFFETIILLRVDKIYKRCKIEIENNKHWFSYNVKNIQRYINDIK